MPFDGSGAPVRLVDGTSIFLHSASIQPPAVFYEFQRGPKTGMWSAPLEWRDSGPMRAGEGRKMTEEYGSIVSPDGRWISYVHVVDGTPAVFVKPVAAPGGPWQVGPAGETPAWSRSSRRLFYRGLSPFRILVADYDVAGDSFAASTPRIWNDIRVESFDMMPDGKHAVIVPNAEQKEATHAVVLLNFLDDLRRRFPPRN